MSPLDVEDLARTYPEGYSLSVSLVPTGLRAGGGTGIGDDGDTPRGETGAYVV